MIINTDGSMNLNALFDTTLFAKGCADPESFTTPLTKEVVQQKIKDLGTELIRRNFPIQPCFIFPLLRVKKNDPKPIQHEEHAYTLFFKEENSDLYLQTFVFTKKTTSKNVSFEFYYRIDWTNHPDLTQRGKENPHQFPHVHFMQEKKGKGKSPSTSPSEQMRIELVFNQTMQLSIQGQLKYQQEITEKMSLLANDSKKIKSLMMTGTLPDIPEELYTPQLRQAGPVHKNYIPETTSQAAHAITLLVQGRKENGFDPYRRTYFFRRVLADQDSKETRLTHTIEWTNHRRGDTRFPHVVEWKDGVAMRAGDGKSCGRPHTPKDFVLESVPDVPQGSSTADEATSTQSCDRPPTVLESTPDVPQRPSTPFEPFEELIEAIRALGCNSPKKQKEAVQETAPHLSQRPSTPFEEITDDTSAQGEC